MVADRPITHLGAEARLELHGCEVRLIFVAPSEEQASELTDLILDQLMSGGLDMTVTGKPIRVTEQ
jgi:hypothetical protein